jgi:hypothetical protein
VVEDFGILIAVFQDSRGGVDETASAEGLVANIVRDVEVMVDTALITVTESVKP